jgi:hypothetical protein
MAVTGITLKDEVTAAFNELKLGKGLKYVIFKIADDFKTVGVEKKSPSGDWAEFVKDLPKVCQLSLKKFFKKFFENIFLKKTQKQTLCLCLYDVFFKKFPTPLFLFLPS